MIKIIHQKKKKSIHQIEEISIKALVELSLTRYHNTCHLIRNGEKSSAGNF